MERKMRLIFENTSKYKGYREWREEKAVVEKLQKVPVFFKMTA